MRNRKWLKPRGEEKKTVEDKKPVNEKEKKVKKQEDEEKQEQKEEQQEVKQRKRSYAEVVASKSDESANGRNARDTEQVGSSDRKLRASTTENTKKSLDKRAARL